MRKKDKEAWHERLHWYACLFVLRRLENRHGQPAADYWGWELTPLPFGWPSLSQYVDGLCMLFGPGKHWRN